MVCRLLEQMQEEVSTYKLPLGLAKALLDKSDDILLIRDGERMLFETNNDLRLSWLFVNALRELPEVERAATAETWFEGTIGGAFLVKFIDTMTGKESNSSETIFPDADFSSLRKSAVTTVRALSKQPDFLRKQKAASLLFSWARLTNYEEVSAWVKTHLDDDASIVDLAAIIPSEVHSSSDGIFYRVDRDGWGRLLDVDDFIARVRAIAQRTKGKDPNLAVIKKFEKALTKDQY